MTICILGRQPALGLSELERLFGADKVQKIGLETALVDVPYDTVNGSRLGGSIKIAELIDEQPSTDWRKLMRYCSKALPHHVQDMPEGKVKLGLSVYDLEVSVPDINKAGLILKKAIRAKDRSVRAVPNTAPALNSAQTQHNQLTSPLGLELVLVKKGTSTLIGQVRWGQNIDSYTLRDRGRPKRDAYVGMLPPKLAQIMINLGTGDSFPAEQSELLASKTHQTKPEAEHLSEQRPDTGELRGEYLPSQHSAFPAEQSELLANGADDGKANYSSYSDRNKRLLDPFCGTGVILQEAALIGYDVYGTDLSERMVEYSEANLQWLRRTFDVHFDSVLHAADAQSAAWQQPIDAVVCETFLGKPLHGLPTPADLQNIMKECNDISRNFLKNIAKQTSSGTPFCVAVPTWWDGKKYHQLTVVDELGGLGYNRVSFEHANNSDLIYRRPDQIVARELLVLIRK
jgi:2-polyprenyl-3-methyl-5-hydroxy-6-metoxy-1,4-benzoquinol methylase